MVIQIVHGGVEMAMNDRQRIVFLAVILVIVAMCAYPPWVLEYKGIELSLGYSLITEPPMYTESSISPVTIDQKMLAGQCVIAGVASLALMWMLKSHKKQTPEGSLTHWRTK